MVKSVCFFNGLPNHVITPLENWTKKRVPKVKCLISGVWYSDGYRKSLLGENKEVVCRGLSVQDKLVDLSILVHV